MDSFLTLQRTEVVSQRFPRLAGRYFTLPDPFPRLDCRRTWRLGRYATAVFADFRRSAHFVSPVRQIVERQ